MTRLLYDTALVLNGVASESPLLVQLPAGGRQIVLAMLERAGWRSTWDYNGQPLTDEQWDLIDNAVAYCVASIEDGEEVNELAAAVVYLADNFKNHITGQLLGLGGGSGGCCTDLITDPANDLASRDDGLIGAIMDELRDLILGDFVDSGTNWPPPYEDRATYESAKCLIANQLFRDFQQTLISLQILDALATAFTAFLLASTLFSAEGAIVGLIAAGFSAPVAALTVVAFLASLIVLGINIGIRLQAVGNRLDRETFVCGMFEAADYNEAKTAMLLTVQNAHDSAVADGVFTFSEIFEGQLLELVAILIPNELLETLFQAVAIATTVAVELPEDYDCTLCSAPPIGGEQFSITDWSPYAGTSLPQASWYKSVGTGNISVPAAQNYLGSSASSDHRAAHEFTIPQNGIVNVYFDRYGTTTNVNVIVYHERWNGTSWTLEQTIGAKAGTGWSVGDTYQRAVTPNLYRISFRLQDVSANVRVKAMSCIYTPD